MKKQKLNNKIVVKRISKKREMIVIITGAIVGILGILLVTFGLIGLIYSVFNPKIASDFKELYRTLEFYYVIVAYTLSPICIFFCFYKPKNVTRLRYSDEYTEPIVLKLKDSLEYEKELISNDIKNYKNDIFCCKFSIEEQKKGNFKVIVYINTTEISKEFFEEYSKNEFSSILNELEKYIKEWKHINIILLINIEKKNKYFDKITKYNMFTNKYIGYLPVFITQKEVYIPKYNDGFGLKEYKLLKDELLKKIKYIIE